MSHALFFHERLKWVNSISSSFFSQRNFSKFFVPILAGRRSEGTDWNKPRTGKVTIKLKGRL